MSDPRIAGTVAARPETSGDVRGRQPQSLSPEDLQHRVDLFFRDYSVDRRSVREAERLIAESEAIAAAFRALGRGLAPMRASKPSSACAVHPPLRHDGGRAWW